jgi:arylsulfatase A-like enzyme
MTGAKKPPARQPVSFPETTASEIRLLPEPLQFSTNHKFVNPQSSTLPALSRRCLRSPLVTGRLPFALAAMLLISLAHRADAANPPNVVIFYADDLGWGELGCQGNKEIPTPNIDAIARNGIRFTQGYVAATYCSPSRAGLMTGRYPTRFGHEFNSVANQTGLRLDQTTIANRLKGLGYATAAVGKWHLGAGTEYRPTKRGFDEFYGTLNNTPFFHPTNFVDSRLSNDVRKVEDPTFYTTDAYAERSIDWLEKNKSKPWFLYLPFNAVHAPLEATKKYLDRFPTITEEKRKTFAAMLSAMDDAVGRVMGKIREMGQEENTIAFYIADNGGPTQSTTSGNGPLRGFKMTTYEGGPRVPFIAQWKGKWPAGKTYDFPVMNLDVLPTVVTAAGGKVDPSWRIDGVDLTPYLTGADKARPHQTLYWRYGPQWAVRHGDLKLVVSRGGGPEPELYNLADDIGESRNLASAQPAKVKELQALWNSWSAEQAEPSAPDAPAGKKKKGGGKNKKAAAK